MEVHETCIITVRTPSLSSSPCIHRYTLPPAIFTVPPTFCHFKIRSPVSHCTLCTEITQARLFFWRSLWNRIVLSKSLYIPLPLLPLLPLLKQTLLSSLLPFPTPAHHHNMPLQPPPTPTPNLQLLQPLQIPQQQPHLQILTLQILPLQLVLLMQHQYHHHHHHPRLHGVRLLRLWNLIWNK